MSSVPRADARVAFIALGAAALGLAVVTLAARVLGEDLPTFLFVGCAVIAAVGLFRPLTAALAAIVASATYGWVVLGPRISVFQLLVVAAAVGVLVQQRAQLLSLARRLIRIPEVLAATGFVAWITLAALVRWPSGDLAYIRNFAGALIFMLLVAILARSTRDRLLMAGALVLGAFATALVGVIQVVNAQALVAAWVEPALSPITDTYARLASPWGLAAIGSNFAKDVISGFVLLVAFLPLARTQGARLLLWIPAVTLAAALVMSGSRSAWLGAGAGLLYIVYARTSRGVMIAIVTMVALLVLCCARPTTPSSIQTAVGLSSGTAKVPESGGAGGGGKTGGAAPSKVEAVSGIRSAESTTLSMELRQRLAKAGWLMVRERPLFGMGPDAFRENVARYVRTTDIDPNPRIPPHNIFVEIASDSGVPALLAFIGFLGAVFVRLERFRRRAFEGPDRALATGLAATLIALIINAQFHNTAEDNALWTVCGIAVALALWTTAQAPSAERVDETTSAMSFSSKSGASGNDSV